MAPTRSATGSFKRRSLAALDGFWHRTFAPDYIGFFLLLGGYFLIAIFVEPFHRMFFINDLRISYPHAEVERVPVTWNIMYCLFLPLLLMIIYNLVTGASSHKHEVSYLCLLISIILTTFITDVIKNAVGRPRPDLLARCNPHPDTKPDVLVTIDVCRETVQHVLQDGWRSFPSGHSSFAFAGLGYLSLFLAGQFHVFRHSHGGRDLTRALVCLAPLLCACLIAISRCEDYRHDVYDVCVGSAIGMTIAYWSYRRHWPHLSSAECHEPHPRPKPESQQEWERIADEETGDSVYRHVGIEMSSLSR